MLRLDVSDDLANEPFANIKLGEINGTMNHLASRGFWRCVTTCVLNEPASALSMVTGQTKILANIGLNLKPSVVAFQESVWAIHRSGPALGYNTVALAVK